MSPYLGPLMSKLTESASQEYIIKWARLSVKTYPALSMLYGTMNGVRLSIGAAMKCKRQGMQKGWPDLQLMYPSGKWHGLFIELKRESGGTLSIEQKWHLSELSKRGYLAVCVSGHLKSIEIIKAYLRADEEEILRLLKA